MCSYRWVSVMQHSMLGLHTLVPTRLVHDGVWHEGLYLHLFSVPVGVSYGYCWVPGWQRGGHLPTCPASISY